MSLPVLGSCRAACRLLVCLLNWVLTSSSTHAAARAFLACPCTAFFKCSSRWCLVVACGGKGCAFFRWLSLLLVAGSTAVQNCSTSTSDALLCHQADRQLQLSNCHCLRSLCHAYKVGPPSPWFTATCRCLASLALLAYCGSCLNTHLCRLNVLHVARAAWCCQ